MGLEGSFVRKGKGRGGGIKNRVLRAMVFPYCLLRTVFCKELQHLLRV